MQSEFDYKKYILLLDKYKLLFAVTALAIMTLVTIAAYLLPKKYESESMIYINKSVLNDLLRGFSGQASGSDSEEQKRLNASIKMLTGRDVLVKVINDVGLNIAKQSDAKLEEIIMSLQMRTQVKLNDNDGLITISFTDKNPQVARDYVNALVQRFIEENLSTKREDSYGATSFLSGQIATYKEKLNKIESQIAALRRAKGAALAADPTTSQPEVSAAQARLDELGMRRAQLDALRSQLRSNNPARSRLATLQKRLEELRVEYTDNYPEVLKVKADIEAAQRELARRGAASSTVSEPQELARVEAELNAVKRSEATQRASLGRSQGLMLQSPVARAELAKLEQDEADTRRVYDQLMARYNQAEISKQMEVQDKSTIYRVVEPATMPLFPSSPNRVRIILMGIAAGIAGGFGLLMAIDYFDKTIRNVDELKPFGIHVAAIIPKISDPKTVALERYRDRKTYMIAGMYFSLIIALLAFESLWFSPVDEVMRLING